MQLFGRQLTDAAYKCGFVPAQSLAGRIRQPTDLVDRLLAGEADAAEVDHAVVHDLAVALAPKGSSRPSEQSAYLERQWLAILGMDTR